MLHVTILYVRRCIYSHTLMANQIKLLDCEVKSSTNPSTSQTDVQIDSADKDLSDKTQTTENLFTS